MALSGESAKQCTLHAGPQLSFYGYCTIYYTCNRPLTHCCTHTNSLHTHATPSPPTLTNGSAVHSLIVDRQGLSGRGGLVEGDTHLNGPTRLTDGVLQLLKAYCRRDVSIRGCGQIMSYKGNTEEEIDLPKMVTVAEGSTMEHPPWGALRSTKKDSSSSGILSSVNTTLGHSTAIPNVEGSKVTRSVLAV